MYREIIRAYGKNIDRNEFYYYDETNNTRKFWLKDKNFNVDPFTKFSLGGMVTTIDIINSNHEELWTELELPKNIKELKAKHIFNDSEDFLELINSKRVNLLLDYINKMGYHVHYNYLNIFFFTIADIVDNAFANVSDLNINPQILKQELYFRMEKDLTWSKKLFEKYNYPSIENQKELINFYNEITQFLLDQNNLNENTEKLIDLFRNIKIKSNLFIAETPNVYIDDLSDLYTLLPNIFPNSKHNFDKETYIQHKLNNLSTLPSNIDWFESKDYRTIQLCDCLISIINRFINYIESNSDEDLAYSFQSVFKNTPMLRQNLILIGTLLYESYQYEPLNIRRITAEDTNIKYNHYVKTFSDLSNLKF